MRPRDFYCERCDAWTPSRNGGHVPFCTLCGEDYRCGECGALITRDGNCTRTDHR